MTKLIRSLAVVVICAALTLPRPAAAQNPGEALKSISTPDKVESRLGTLDFKDGAPSKPTVDKVYDNLDFTHAFRTFVDTMQGVSINALHKALLGAGVKDNAEPDADGSTTIYLGPKQPEGVKRSNWIQTMPDKGWFTILRLYSPLEPFFTKQWRPSEILPVQ